MRTIFLSSLFVSILFSNAFGQSSKGQKPARIKFSTVNQVGLLTGDNGQSATLQTISGVRYKKWFGGIGTGIDYYANRSIPVFIAINRKLNDKPVALFLYANGGLNYSWATKNQKASKGYTAESKPGGYFEGGLGLHFKTKHGSAFLLSAGYSYKQFKDNAEMLFFTIWIREPPRYETYNYQYRRLVVKFGFQL